MDAVIITIWLPSDIFIETILAAFAVLVLARIIWRLIPVAGG